MPPDQYVGVLHARCEHAHPDLALARIRQGSLDHLQPVGIAEAPDLNNPVARLSHSDSCSAMWSASLANLEERPPNSPPLHREWLTRPCFPHSFEAVLHPDRLALESWSFDPHLIFAAEDEGQSGGWRSKTLTRTSDPRVGESLLNFVCFRSPAVPPIASIGPNSCVAVIRSS